MYDSRGITNVADRSIGKYDAVPKLYLGKSPKNELIT
jgi:hypothetical protein